MTTGLRESYIPKGEKKRRKVSRYYEILKKKKLEGKLTEVETTVNDDTDDGGKETTVETGDTIGSEGLLVDIEETVELTFTSVTTLGGTLVVGSETSTGVVEGVDEEEGGGTSSSSRGKVTGHPECVTVLGLGVGEQRLVVILESEVEGLGREVTDDVGGVSSPERDESLIGVGTSSAIGDTLVRSSKTSRLEHLTLVLDQN